jgi:hypothetical protein
MRKPGKQEFFLGFLASLFFHYGECNERRFLPL